MAGADRQLSKSTRPDYQRHLPLQTGLLANKGPGGCLRPSRGPLRRVHDGMWKTVSVEPIR